MKGVKPTPKTTLGRPWLFLVLHAVVLLAGVFSAFRPTLVNAGARLQSDPGDTVLNHYILEHSWLWLTRADYAGTLWTPPFFYPASLTLAYSENLLGSAPLYWLLRLAWSPAPAYAAWMILVCALNYLAMTWVLTRLAVRHSLCAFGAFVFAFGLPRVVQIGHQQLLPHLFAPLAVYACWSMLLRPRLHTLAGLLAASFLQTLSSIYLGWFLHLSLAVFLLWMLLTHRGRASAMITFVRRWWLPASGMVAVWSVLLGLLIGVYREANHGFVRDWEECANYLPDAGDWLLPPALSVHAAWLGVASKTLNAEHWVFPGWVVLGMTALGLGLAVGRSRIFPTGRSRLVLALLGTALTLALLSLRDLGQGTAWWWVYQYAPGARAIRAVGRIGLVVLLFALMGGLLALEAYLQAPARWQRGKEALAALALLLGGGEQVAVILPSFETASFYARADALARKMNRGTAVYLLFEPDMEWHTGQLLAMWAGQRANRPVVNGYSGRLPDGYPESQMLPGYVFGWLALHVPADKLWPGRLLYVAPTSKGEYGSVLLEADRGPAVAAR